MYRAVLVVLGHQYVAQPAALYAVGEPTAQQRHDGAIIVAVYAARGERERYKGVELGVALYIVPDGGAAAPLAAPLIGGAALLLRGFPLLPCPLLPRCERGRRGITADQFPTLRVVNWSGEREKLHRPDFSLRVGIELETDVVMAGCYVNRLKACKYWIFADFGTGL